MLARHRAAIEGQFAGGGPPDGERQDVQRNMSGRAILGQQEQPGSAFVPDSAGAWREILCIQEARQVGNDNTVKWRTLRLQIPPSPLRPHFVKATVRVHEYPDGTLAVRELADVQQLGLAAAVGLRLVLNINYNL